MAAPDVAARPAAADLYFAADVETDGPIPGEYSMLSFALVYAGRFDGATFERAPTFETSFQVRLRPISDRFEAEALAVNGLDRERVSTAMGTPTCWATGVQMSVSTPGVSMETTRA